MKSILFRFCTLVLILVGVHQTTTAQTTNFDYMHSNVGSQKTISWNTSSFGSGFGHRLISIDPGGSTTLNLQARHNTSVWTDVVTFNTLKHTNFLGTVGIGVGSSNFPLHLKSVASDRSRFEYATTTIDLVDYGTSSNDYSESAGMFVNGRDALVMSGSGKGIRLVTHDGSTYKERLRILSNGRVGINTKNPSHQLSVNGTIGAKEINVTTSGWADYVFKPEYELMPLNEVEQFIRDNGRLPNIPTEAEVMEHGVNLAEMVVKLLEKVEELTLYSIEQNTQIKALQAELKSVER